MSESRGLLSLPRGDAAPQKACPPSWKLHKTLSCKRRLCLHGPASLLPKVLPGVQTWSETHTILGTQGHLSLSCAMVSHSFMDTGLSQIWSLTPLPFPPYLVVFPSFTTPPPSCHWFTENQELWSLNYSDFLTWARISDVRRITAARCYLWKPGWSSQRMRVHLAGCWIPGPSERSLRGQHKSSFLVLKFAKRKFSWTGLSSPITCHI